MIDYLFHIIQKKDVSFFLIHNFNIFIKCHIFKIRWSTFVNVNRMLSKIS
jgi:hypothetical protein